MKRVCLISFLVLLLAPVTLSQTAQEQIQAQTKELERIKAELENKRNSIEKLKRQEKGILAGLSDLEEELELVNKLIKKMKIQERTLTKHISRRNLELLGGELTLKQKRELLALKLNQIYRYGKFQETRLLLSSESPVDFLKRYYFLEKLTQKNRELVSQVLDYISQTEKAKKELENTLAELQKLKQDKQKEEKSQQQVLAQKERLLKNVRQEKKLQEEAYAQLEQSRLKIQKIIESLEAERTKAPLTLPEGVFAASKGKLPWPLKGNILATFGEQVDPKTKTVTFNPGLLIGTEMGTLVQAVADGVVIYNSWLRGYGRFIILQHDSGFYTLYAHLDEVLVENETLVRAGDSIALAGDSGSLSGPALYFEIRQGKEQLDPLEWLR